MCACSAPGLYSGPIYIVVGVHLKDSSNLFTCSMLVAITISRLVMPRRTTLTMNRINTQKSCPNDSNRIGKKRPHNSFPIARE